MQECEVGKKNNTLQPSIDLFKNMQISICLLFFFFKLLERLMRQIFFQSSDEDV